MSKSAKIIIVISLLLNLMLAGVIIGHAFHLLGDGMMNHSMKEMAKLSPERQQELKTTMDKVKHDTEVIHQEIVDTRERTIDILTAEHFDENAYEDKIDHITELKAANQHRLGDAIKKLAIHWSAVERQQLAEILRHPLIENKNCSHDGPPPGK